MPIAQDAHVRPACRAVLAAQTPFTLAALGVIVPALGSLVLGLALLEDAIAPDAALAIATLDERAQAEQWGWDEQANDRQAAMAEDVRAATRFMRLAAGRAECAPNCL